MVAFLNSCRLLYGFIHPSCTAAFSILHSMPSLTGQGQWGVQQWLTTHTSKPAFSPQSWLSDYQIEWNCLTSYQSLAVRSSSLQILVLDALFFYPSSKHLAMNVESRAGKFFFKRTNSHIQTCNESSAIISLCIFSEVSEKFLSLGRRLSLKNSVPALISSSLEGWLGSNKI